MDRQRSFPLADRILLLFSPLKGGAYTHRCFYESFPSYSKGAVRRALSDLKRAGRLERVKARKGFGFTLTDSGRTELLKLLPRRWKKREWDGKLWVITFDIPNKYTKKRNLLRTKLLELGYLMWQRSFYISLDSRGGDLLLFLENHGLKHYVSVFGFRDLLFEELSEFINKVWRVDNLDNQYQAFIDDWRSAKEVYRGMSSELFSLARSFQKRFIELIPKDPGLPPEALPPHWPYAKAVKVFAEVMEVLSESS